MKLAFLAPVAVLLSTAPALANADTTPHARSCMAKYGFTIEQWRAYAVPASKAEPYRQCRDGSSANTFKAALPVCLRQAGVSSAAWANRQATIDQGRTVRDCMAAKGLTIQVHNRDGSNTF